MERRMPLRLKKAEFSGDFAGWVAILRPNVSLETAGVLGQATIAQISEALPKVIVAWNFVDESGALLGKPVKGSEDELIQKFGPGVINALQEQYRIINDSFTRNGVPQSDFVSSESMSVPTTEEIKKIPVDLLAMIAEEVADAISDVPLAKKSK